jgi:CMP-N,N'-diacetyllegionaminic acid synthase
MKPSIAAIIPISGTDPEFVGNQIPTLGGKSLIEYTIDAAQQSNLIERILVSTDQEHVRKASLEFGVSAPFLRPPELANPIAPVTEVLRHATLWLQENENFIPDWIVMLLITYPFRPKGFVDTFIRTVLSQDLDSAFAAIEERYSHWHINDYGMPELMSFGSDTAREKKKSFYRDHAGLISMAKREIILSGGLYGNQLGILPTQDMWAVLNIHDPVDTQIIQYLAPHFPGNK